MPQSTPADAAPVNRATVRHRRHPLGSRPGRQPGHLREGTRQLKQRREGFRRRRRLYAMGAVTLTFLRENLEWGEMLKAGRDSMFEPQDLPGRYGRVVKAIDHVLAALDCVSVLG